MVFQSVLWVAALADRTALPLKTRPALKTKLPAQKRCFVSNRLNAGHLFLVHFQMGLKLVLVRCGVFTAWAGTQQHQAAVLLDLVPFQRAFGD